MVDRVTSHATNRVAVVTGANKGIGLEISRQLASNGVMVVLTARDEKRGLESVKNLKASGLSNIIFHQLDVMDPASIASLADFIKTQFGKLDILMNNAGVIGATTDWEKLIEIGVDSLVGENAKLLKEFIEQPYEKAEACLATNYYGAKRVTEAVIPLLQSNSAKIVNVSSTFGQLELISNERAKKELSDVDGLTEEKVEEVLQGFLEDVKEGLAESKGWPTNFSAYMVSKAALNAYTRVLAKKYPHIAINAVCPGYIKTDINDNSGVVTVEEGAKGPVMLALMPEAIQAVLSSERELETSSAMKGLRGKLNKEVIAYSGGLDTSVIVPWLRENYGCDVVCFTADVGQGVKEMEGLDEKAKASVACQLVVKDLKEEFVREYIFPCLRAGDLNGTPYYCEGEEQ